VLQGSGNINGTGNGLFNGIAGNGGNNVLAGQGGNDALEGNGGNDFLFGQAGQDSLVGGLGNDTFVYQVESDSIAGPNCDYIRDFDDADDDRIDLGGVFAGTLSYIGEDAFTGANQVRVQVSGANIVVAVNLDADTPPEMQILLLGTTVAQMGVDDFIL
jgi:Ca2+-binding RTX toxin-like protein